MYGGAAAPEGWLLCDGTAISRTGYSVLFAILSTTYGVGDSSTTFNLPDCRGVFVRGAGAQTISTIAYTGTRGTTQGDQIQGHFHQEQHAAALGGATAQVLGTGAGNNTSTDSQNWTKGPSTDGSNGTPRTGTETRPANISLSYIIKI